MKLAAHLIPNHWSQSDEQQLARLQPKSIKVVDHFSRVPQLFALCPRSLFVLRDHPLSEQKDDAKRDPFRTGVRHADEWHTKLEQWQWPIPREQIVVLGINEPPVWDDPAPWVAYTVAFLDALRGYGIRGGALNLSVGWPANNGPDTPPDWTPYELVRTAIRRGNHFLVLHEYWDHEGPDHNWGWWAGRYTKCPWDVPIIIGECGIDEYVRDGSVHADKRGWQGWLQAADYVAQLARYERRLQEDRRIHSAQIYTWDFSHPWASFNIQGEVLNMMPENTDFQHVYVPQVNPPLTNTTVTVPPLVHPLAPALQQRITQRFGERPEAYAKFDMKGHNGLDFGIPAGTPVHAVADGQAVEVLDDPNGYGLYVKLVHPWGHSLYAHLSKQTVMQGTQVKAGDLIGLSGNTGNSTGAHLHFAMRVHPFDRNDGFKGYTDPLPYLTTVSLPTPVEPETVNDLLARLITAEAGGESALGQLAVAHVVKNRVERGGWWGNSWTDVIRYPHQFAKPADVATPIARAIADLVLQGFTKDPTDASTHFHSGPAPDWARSLTFVRQIGNHRFFRED